MAKKQITNSNQKYIIWGAVAVSALFVFFAVQAYMFDSAREPENPGILQTIEGLQNKEELPDGAKRYTFDSPNPSRPNMYIGKEENDLILFERSVISQEGKPITLTDYDAAYGEPEQVISGTQFYGSETNLYIYGSKGIAFIANPQTDRILELHTFPVMSAEEYLQKYGDEN